MSTEASDFSARRDELIRLRLAEKKGTWGGRIPRADREGPIGLSSGQQQMWFLNRLDPGSPEYLVPLALRLRGRLDHGSLERAWREVIARHESLRTRYVLVGEDPTQVIDEPYAVRLPVDDLHAVDGEGMLDAVGAVVATSFDLAAEWPARARLLRLADDDHVLVLVFHHIACDAWSLAVVVGELAELYSAFTEGSPSPLAPLETQYADYAAWESGRSFDRSLAYWRERLADLRPLDLPTDRPRPATRVWTGDVDTFEIPAPLAERLREVARRHGSTLFTVLLTAFKLLLSRHTGLNDIPVGTMVSGRTRPELQGLVGYCINSLVVRSRWEGDPAFADLLAQVRNTVLEAFDHQDVPFAQLVDELQPERDLSRTPLFQVAFTFEPASDGPAWTGLEVAPLPGRSRVSRFDLTLLVKEAPDGSLSATIEYVPDLFDRARVTRMGGHLLRLLDGVADDPGARVSHLELLGADELAVVLPTAEVGGVSRCVHEVFEERVVVCPDAVAVVCGEVRLSYGEVNARANRLAHCLLGLGVGSLVGVCLGRGVDLVPVLLGVLKAGAGYVPLDPAVPAERLGGMLADSGVSVVVTSSDLAGLVGGVFSGRVVVVDEVDFSGFSDVNPGVVCSPGGVVYVIYTSGSTGRPKGVVLEHRNVVRLLEVAERHYGFSSDDVWVLCHSFAFDVSVWELWGSLLYGGVLVVVPREVTRSPEDLLGVLVRHGVTVLNQTPSAFRGLVGLAGEGRVCLDRLRVVVFAGEKLELAELAPWVERFGLERPALVNMYGITETTVHTTYHRLVAGDLLPGGGNPVGRPLADLRVYLLDAFGCPVPVGVAGEIYVGGPGVARGYLNRPSLTAERFVPDPFGPVGGRLYRSGDLASRRADGSLDFLGRVDDQVKVRGFRIELGEIVAVLRRVEGVVDAVVVVREDVPGDRRLVGYVVGEGVDPVRLREELSRSLPEYMVPSAFVGVAAIPLNNNGKLDRRALPVPGRGALAAGVDFVAPRSVVEELVAGIWRDVLGVERVGVHDNFFELGGHSIRAVALVGALRKNGFDISVRDVFEHRTIAELMDRLPGLGSPLTGTPLVRPFELLAEEDRAAMPSGVSDAYPLAYVQAGMLLELMAGDERNPYHNVTSFRVRDERPFDPEAFRAAARLVTRRHEVLRTSFDLDGYSVPLQLVHTETELHVEVRDLSGLGEAEVGRSLRRFTADERARLFDLTRPGLIRLFAHVCDDRSWWLSVTECHAILEGWSHHSMLMELLEYYRVIRDGAVPDPAPLPALRYADFVAAEQRSLESEDDRAFWRGVVTDHPKLALPETWGDRPDTPRAVRQAVVSFTDLEDGLRALAAAAGVPLKSVLLAAYMKVLSQITDQESFHTGLVLHGRPEADGADRVYGLYLNTLPFPYTRGARTWHDLVNEVFTTETAMWRHRRFPLGAIQHETGGRLLDGMFIYLDFDQVDTELVDYLASIDDSPTEFPLHVSVRVGHVAIAVDTHVIGERNADRLAEMYRQVLVAMAADPYGDARTVFLPASDRALLDGLTAEVGGVSRCVHEVFEERVVVCPDAVAVVCGEVRLSYGEVNARANRLAHCLLGLGVGSLVGVCLGRGVDLVPVLLGVLKAGAGYVPLDPAVPAERLGGMLADSGVSVVVTSSDLAGLVGGVFSGRVVVVDEVDFSGFSDVNPGVVCSPGGVVYVIYTSGSTGRPKGVVLEHRNVVRLLEVAERHYGFSSDDVWVLCHSFAFDVSVWELWGSLLYGGVLVVVPREVTRSPEDLLGVLVRHGVTVLNQTPSAFRGLVGLAGEGRVCLDRLRVVVFAGEKLELAELAPWVERFGLERPALVNMYGITETTVHTTYHRLVAGDLLPGGGNPVGRPLADLRVYLLDAFGCPVPVGVAGEIYVGGPGVARGYLNRPSLTAERFVPDPFGPVGGRLYRSGDLASRRADGSLDFLGRVDDQVKVRGFRIELGEIVAVLRRVEGVVDAVVVVREDVPGDRRLVGYVVGEGVDPVRLREELSRSLPEYMVPSAFVGVAAIPLNNNGKLDRRALPVPGRGALAAGVDFVAPRSVVEELVAGIWRDVLGVERVGVHDNFFELGGHSIRAVALVGALRKNGFDVEARDVFEHATVARLSERLAGRNRAVEEVTPIEPFALVSAHDRQRLAADVVDAYPLAQAQLGILLEMLANQDQHLYQNVTSFRVRDERPFDREAFRAAARLVTRRHEVLRTSFDLDGYSVPLQLVHTDAEVPLDVRDCRELTPEAVAELVRRHTEAEQRARLPLDTAPLMRVTVHVAQDDAWWLSVSENHAILEGWSHYSMLMELLEYYQTIRDGAVPDPAPLPALRYADFVAAEQRSLESEDDRAFWRGVVTDHPKLALPGTWGDPGPAETYELTISIADLDDGLRALARTSGTSLKSVLLAAHLKVLSQITDQESFHSGLVLQARPEVDGADRLYGLFLNTLPFPHTRGARIWRDLVYEVFTTETAMWRHRRFPMPAIQREAGDGGRLIDTIFTFLDFEQVDTELVEVGGALAGGGTEFPLAVGVIAGNLGITADTTVLSRADAGRLAAMYRAVLEAMAADPLGDARAVHLPPGEGEPDTVAETGPYPTVHEAFEARVRTCPDAVAVVSGQERLTYRELDTRANRLAHHLRALETGPLVGVCLDRGAELTPTLLGVLKSGAGYVPLDPAVPAERLGRMLSDSDVSVVVTTADLAPMIREVFTGRIVPIDERSAEIGALPGTPPPPSSTAGDIMYVIYTSGSTGRPKGVCVSHANAMWLLDETRTYLSIDDDDVFTLFASFANDVAVGEMFGALLNGGRLVVVPQEVTRSPEDFLDLLVRHRVTVIDQTPSSLRGLVRLAQDGDPRTDRLALRVVLIGGEKLEAGDVAAWIDRFGVERPILVNVYGNTEATSNSTFQRITAGTLAGGGSPIGVPMPGVRIQLLDREGHQVPAGVPGEIHIGGAGVSLGYLGRPGLTAERYVPDPQGPPGSRRYRTGDLGLRRSDGTMEFLGRVDDQVKIRGHRIEPGEIAALLQEQPGVRHAVVVVREDPPGDRRLVGYVVGDEVDPARLRAALSRSLPDHMVPYAYVRMAEIPLNHNGKLDHRALPVPDRAALATGGDHVAPSTPTERTLAEIWARVLDVPEVGARDTFFGLGGHSILMIQAIREVKQAGLPISLLMMYQHETVADLAAAIDAAPGGARGATGAEQGPVTGELTLTPIQHWFLAEEGHEEPFAQRALLTVEPAADPDLLGRALRELTRHHDVLRLRVEDGRGHLAEEAPAGLLRVVDDLTEPGSEPADHDLAAGRVLSAALSRSGSQLLLSIHHLAVDIVSWAILLEDLNTVYSQLEAGRPVELPAKTTSVRQWARELAEYAGSTELAAQTHHWLSRAPLPDIPVDRPGPNRTADARTLLVGLPENLTSTLLHRAGDTATAEETVLAALGLALTGWTGGDGFLVELEGHGRQEELFDGVDLSRTVGWFTSVYPFAAWLPPGRKPQAVLRSVRDQFRAVPGRGIGHGVSRWLSPDEDLVEALAAQQRPAVLFNYTGQGSVGTRGRTRFALSPEGLGSVEGSGRPRSHLLEVNAGVHRDRLYMHWTYSAALHDEETVRRVADDCLARLTALLEPARPVAIPSPLPAMRRHNVPGVAVAVIRGQSVEVHAHGVLAAGQSREVTPDTLFQVGSIGKHLTAIGVLRLVEAGLLDLDADVNDHLVSWKLPKTIPGTVTARWLLSHQAGLTRTDEDDFRRGEPMPALLDLLPAVAMELTPGEHFRKSNGHYWVLEQLMSDVAGEPYQELMRELVFEPLDMRATSYDLTFPETSGLPVAHGHDEHGRTVPGGWLNRPALAAGSLWSTAPDLAKVAIAVRRAHLGHSGAVLPRALAAELLTVAHREALYGLGTSVDDTGGDIEFGHVGESAGYRSMMLSRINRATGFVVLTNSESGKELHKHVAAAIGEQEGMRYGQGQGRTEAGYR